MEIDVSLIHVLKLTSREYTLISKALRRTLKIDDLPEADELQRRMAEKKIQMVNQLNQQMKTLEENLKLTQNSSVSETIVP